MYISDGTSKPRTQTARRLATRQALIDSARDLFAAEGYAATPTEAIVRRAAVSRGALYHHFSDKQDLFRAVVETIEREIDDRVQAAALGASDVAGAFAAGTDAYLDACLLPDVKQILLVDGPSVLGWRQWRELDARHALAQIELGLQELINAGILAPQSVAPLAQLVHGALIAAALAIAGAADPDAMRSALGTSLQNLLGIRNDPAPATESN